MRKVESVTAFDAKEIAIDPALIAIIAANDLGSGIATAREV